MPTLPLEMMPLVMTFAPVFSQRVFQYAQELLIGCLLARGARTVLPRRVRNPTRIISIRCFLLVGKRWLSSFLLRLNPEKVQSSS